MNVFDLFVSKGGQTARGACIFSYLQEQMMYLPGTGTSSQLFKICDIHPVPLLFLFLVFPLFPLLVLIPDLCSSQTTGNTQQVVFPQSRPSSPCLAKLWLISRSFSLPKTL